MADRREYRLTLYPSRDRTEWRLVRVDWRGGEPSYHRIEGGSLPLSVRGGTGFLLDLSRIGWELRRRWHTSPEPEAPREPLGGGGGDRPLPGLEHLGDVLRWTVEPLDGLDSSR